ncbi:peptidylprolyl isomerase, partial [Arthrobacter deserti]|nr:peptidylprolyl isomerase [Arthrobacter deserti]
MKKFFLACAALVLGASVLTGCGSQPGNAGPAADG